jgi:HEAT repeat protein
MTVEDNSGQGGWWNDARPTADLIEYALKEPDEEKAWEAVGALQLRGTQEVFDAARDLCASDDAARRALGADILGELGTPDMPFREESVGILLGLLAAEQDPSVLHSIAVALGQLHDPRGIGPLLKLTGHPDAAVREGVASGLGGVLQGVKGHRDDSAIHALIELSSDENVDVRDYATTALASETLADVRMLEINDALLARTGDDDEEVRGEALLGLGLRKDRRVVEPLLRELSGRMRDEYVRGLLFEAALEIADPALCPTLLQLKQRGLKDDLLDKAITVCRRAGASG